MLSQEQIRWLIVNVTEEISLIDKVGQQIFDINTGEVMPKVDAYAFLANIRHELQALNACSACGKSFVFYDHYDCDTPTTRKSPSK